MAEDLAKKMEQYEAAEALAQQSGETEAGPVEEIGRFIEQVPEHRAEKLLGYMNPKNESAPLSSQIEWVSAHFADRDEFVRAADSTINSRIGIVEGTEADLEAKREQYRKVAGYVGKLFEDKKLFGKK